MLYIYKKAKLKLFTKAEKVRFSLCLADDDLKIISNFQNQFQIFSLNSSFIERRFHNEISLSSKLVFFLFLFLEKDRENR